MYNRAPSSAIERYSVAILRYRIIPRAPAMAAEFLARAKVSFVKTAVLSSNDGGNTFSEETILKEKTDEQGNKISESELNRLEKANNRHSTGTVKSLYEQLEQNKMEKDEAWKAKHGPQAPKGLDEEDVLFLNEQSWRQAERRREVKKAEEDELASFRNAQRQKKQYVNNSSNDKRRELNSDATTQRSDNESSKMILTRKSKLPSNFFKKRQRVPSNDAKEIRLSSPKKIKTLTNSIGRKKDAVIDGQDASSRRAAGDKQKSANIAALDFLNDFGDDSSSEDENQ